MLHLYQQYTACDETEKPSWPQHQTLFDIQAFATTLFQWAHAHCPQFEVFAWGMHSKANDSRNPYPWEAAGDASKFVSELFFVKKVYYDDDGKENITASFTARSRLYANFPGLVLPTCDPGFDELARHAFG
jgi:hypothetical protein